MQPKTGPVQPSPGLGWQLTSKAVINGLHTLLLTPTRNIQTAYDKSFPGLLQPTDKSIEWQQRLYEFPDN